MIYLNDYVLSLMRDKLKIGSKQVNVRVEVDKYDYIPNQITEFYYAMLDTDTAAPSVNLNAPDEIIEKAVTISFPIEGKSLSDFEPIRESSLFGAPRERDGVFHHYHRGIDFGGSKGDHILAAADGEVTSVQRNVAYGGHIISILHDNGYLTRYLHLDGFANVGGRPIQVGDRVKQGQLIAYMGQTGMEETTQYKNNPNGNFVHLHFEIRTGATKSSNGKEVDPLPYLKGEKRIRDVGEIYAEPDNSTESLHYDLTTDKVYSSNFNSINDLNEFVQGADRAWGISKDGDLPVLTLIKSVKKASMISKSFRSTNDTIVSIRYKSNLSGGEKFSVTLGGNEVFSTTASTDGYTNITIQAPASLNGAQTLVLSVTPHSSVTRPTPIYIEKIEIVNRYTKLLDASSTKVSLPDTLVANNNLPSDAYMKNAPEINSQNIAPLESCKTYPYVETVLTETHKWYKILYNSAEAYVLSDYATLKSSSGITEMVYKIPTGAFVFSKTLTIEDVISIDIDYKYEMRAAEATFTIANKNGYYSPDYNPARFSEYGTEISEFSGVFVENAPVRIYIGYGDKLQRRFTGLVSNVSVASDGSVLTVTCVDMMKLLNDFYNYNRIEYGNEREVWLASSVIQDLANRAGMNSWKTVNEDLARPSIVIEESYYTDVRPESGIYVTFDEYGKEITKTIASVPDGTGFRNPAWWNTSVPVGTNFAEYIENICTLLGYWQRCDCYGTYRATTIPFMYGQIPTLPQFRFVDGEDLISVNKNYDYSKIRNHLIISGPFDADHFFDIELWKYTQGKRKTASEYYDFANTYGRRYMIAKKLFFDIKSLFRTLQVAVEGNPYIELMDSVEIVNFNTNTKGMYIVKGIKDSYNVDQGYITNLDLYWMEG